MTAPLPADPGATPTAARALAPDLARGCMLLLIALANVHLWSYGHPLGVRSYPADLDAVDRVVTVLQLLLVDGRAYPLFGFLFGYGIVQLTRRRGAVGMPVDAVSRLVRRRGWFMVLIGLVHGALLWAGDIVGAYGLIAVVLAGMLVRGTDRVLVIAGVVGAAFSGLLYAGASLPVPAAPDAPQAVLVSMTVAAYPAAAGLRIFEWLLIGFLVSSITVFGAVALGAWAARRGLLDEPGRHRPLLVRVAVAGLGAAVLLGLPLALLSAQVWTGAPLGVIAVAGALHALSGYAGGLGYAALFGLLAVRLAGGTGPFTSALRACGQRSLSCYLAQSVAFAVLLPAWTFGLGAGAHVWQTALYGVATWLVILVVAAVTARAGYRGPAELLLRRLTYGRRKAAPVTG